MSYKTKLVKDDYVKNSNKKLKVKVVNIKKDNNKMMKMKDIQKLFMGIKEKYKDKKNKIMNIQIKALCPGRWTTLINSAKNHMDMNENDFIDYYGNKVKNDNKFNAFGQIEIIVQYKPK